jgi:hypothetical protein
VTDAVRRVGYALGIGIAAAFAVGIVLALYQDESVVLWFAYMLDIAGAIVIALALFSVAPTSARKAVSRRYLEEQRADGDEDGAEEVPKGAPILGDLALLMGAGVALLALGLVVELAA